MHKRNTHGRIQGRKGVAIRLERLRQEALCRHCLAKDIVRLATEVDHIIPLYRGGEDVDGNVQSLCEACHEAKTAKDMGYKAPKQQIGADGWPK